MEPLSPSEIAQRPAPPNNPAGVLHRSEEMSDLSPVQQVDIIEERHGGAAADPVVKVVVREFDTADTRALAADPDTIPALEADFTPQNFTKLSAWDLDRNERMMSEFDGKVGQGTFIWVPSDVWVRDGRLLTSFGLSFWRLPERANKKQGSSSGCFTTPLPYTLDRESEFCSTRVLYAPVNGV